MKGRTIIELIDEKTGEREVIADNNMIGPAVQELLNAYTKWPGNQMLFRHLSPLYQKMFGGILLFEDQVAETETMVPAGNKVVGAGSYKFSDQLSNVNGDYNMIESEVTATYAKHVWDFKTNQANGRISSICLCDAVYTRDYMYGNDYLQTAPSVALNTSENLSQENFSLPIFGYGLRESSSNLNLREFCGHASSALSPSSPCIVYIEDDFSGYVTAEFETETTITFRKMKVHKNEIDLLSNAGGTLLGLTTRHGVGLPPVEIESKTFTLPSTVKSKYPGFSYDQTTKKFYLAYGMTSTSTLLAVNASVTFITFNFANNDLASTTMEQGTFTNKSGQRLNIGSNNNYSTVPFLLTNATDARSTFSIVGNYLYTLGTNCAFKINIKDNSEVIKIVSPETGISETSSSNGFVFCLNGYLYVGSTRSTYKTYVIDTVKNTMFCVKKSYAFFTSNSYEGNLAIPTKTPQLIVGASYATHVYIYPTCLVATRNYLSTINNLAQPVVKTNDKSMKVTYILEVDNG